MNEVERPVNEVPPQNSNHGELRIVVPTNTQMSQLPLPRLVPPPEFLERLAELLRPIHAAAAQFSERLAAHILPIHQAIVQGLAPQMETLRRMAAMFVEFGQAWFATLPENWRGLESPATDVPKVVELMQETGWCVAWCPRSEILQELLDLKHDPIARTKALLDRQDLVVKDLRESLAHIEGDTLESYRTYASKALDAFEAGHPECAQALAASCLSAIINSVYGLSFSAARTTFEHDPMDAELLSFRSWCVEAMLSRSLKTFYPEKGDAVPGEFSRHASAHTVSPAQYTEVNCLASLLLLNAILREESLARVPEIAA